MAKRSGLGKGLDALFIDNTTEDGAVTTLKLAEIEPNKLQPRRAFEDSALQELADSIREHGVIQPLVVRPIDSGGYQIVAGERRWRAARMAGLGELPVVIRELDDAQTLEIAIIENLQREDLNPVELAEGYKILINQHHMTQEQVADRLGKSRPVIANAIRILALPDSVLDLVREGKVSTGHAKALLAIQDQKLLEETARRAATGELLVRDIEKIARDQKQASGQGDKKAAKDPGLEGQDAGWGDSFYREMELALSAELGRRVRITQQGKKAVLELEFYNREELADIAARLAKTSW